MEQNDKQLILEKLAQLVRYGIDNMDLNAFDGCCVNNYLIAAFNLYEAAPIPDSFDGDLYTDILQPLSEMALKYGLCDQYGVERFKTKLMGYVLPSPSQIVDMFDRKVSNQGVRDATTWFYQNCQKSTYLNVPTLNKNKCWIYDGNRGSLVVNINVARPEKDPKEIELAKSMPQTNYPKCMLCEENIGYSGRLNFPARQTLRFIPIPLEDGTNWCMQFSPYRYFDQHCIFFNEKHVPMDINGDTFSRMVELLTNVPHYFIGSNAPLPIVGGSILAHDHYQGGSKVMPIFKAKFQRQYTSPEYPDVKVYKLDWYNSVIRLKSKNKEELVKLANFINDVWAIYTDPRCNIYAQTNGTPHNAITPIFHLERGELCAELFLRNNRTDDAHPYGIFHPTEDLHFIKKEGIGVIEVMGTFILPGRLAKVYEQIKDIVKGKVAFNEAELSKSDNPLCPYLGLIKSIMSDVNVANDDLIEAAFNEFVSEICEKVLECTAVFKEDEVGKKSFERFMSFLGFEGSDWNQTYQTSDFVDDNDDIDDYIGKVKTITVEETGECLIKAAKRQNARCAFEAKQKAKADAQKLENSNVVAKKPTQVASKPQNAGVKGDSAASKVSSTTKPQNNKASTSTQQTSNNQTKQQSQATKPKQNNKNSQATQVAKPTQNNQSKVTTPKTNNQNNQQQSTVKRTDDNNRVDNGYASGTGGARNGGNGNYNSNNNFNYNSNYNSNYNKNYGGNYGNNYGSNYGGNYGSNYERNNGDNYYNNNYYNPNDIDDDNYDPEKDPIFMELARNGYDPAIDYGALSRKITASMQNQNYGYQKNRQNTRYNNNGYRTPQGSNSARGGRYGSNMQQDYSYNNPYNNSYGQRNDFDRLDRNGRPNGQLSRSNASQGSNEYVDNSMASQYRYSRGNNQADSDYYESDYEAEYEDEEDQNSYEEYEEDDEDEDVEYQDDEDESEDADEDESDEETEDESDDETEDGDEDDSEEESELEDEEEQNIQHTNSQKQQDNTPKSQDSNNSPQNDEVTETPEEKAKRLAELDEEFERVFSKFFGGENQKKTDSKQVSSGDKNSTNRTATNSDGSRVYTSPGVTRKNSNQTSIGIAKSIVTASGNHKIEKVFAQADELLDLIEKYKDSAETRLANLIMSGKIPIDTTLKTTLYKSESFILINACKQAEKLLMAKKREEQEISKEQSSSDESSSDESSSDDSNNAATVEVSSNVVDQVSEQPPKRKRGRPRKVVVEVEQVANANEESKNQVTEPIAQTQSNIENKQTVSQNQGQVEVKQNTVQTDSTSINSDSQSDVVDSSNVVDGSSVVDSSNVVDSSSVGEASEQITEEPPKRKRGRPRKNPI